MVTVKSGWKTYTKPANASAGWLKQAKASTPVVKPATASSTTPSVKNFTGGDPDIITNANYYATPAKPTVAPTLSNFGDVNKQGTKYTGPWYATATMATGKDFTKVAQLAAPGQSFDRFGKSAEQMNMKTPGFIDQRNDTYITELARANPTFNQLTEAEQKKQIKDLLIQRDTNKELYSGGNGEVDVNNTINSIYNRIGQGKSQQEIQTELATSLYDKDIQKIDAQYQSEKNNFLKAGAVEDRFTNFNEVNDKIKKTLIAAGQHRQDNLYTGTPTDQQIQEIANGLWQDFATTKKIMEGRGYEALELQPNFQDEASQSFNRGLTDLEISRNRALEDATNQSLKTQTAITEQIDDVKLQMDRQIGMWEKAGALSGALKSSGYMAWLDGIKNDALKNVDRLQTRADRDTEDTATYKKRINETYELNASRTKEDLDKALNQLKSQVGTEMSQYLNEYAPSSVELWAQLDAITDKYGIMSQNALNTYMTNLRGITDTMAYDTEKVMSLQKMKQDIQQTNVNNMLANNGMALSGINYTDLNTMLSSGDISPTDYSTMAGYMQSLGISQLQKMWVPTAEDISLYNTLLEKNVSPQQAIATITAQNPSRYSGTGDANWSIVDVNGKSMRFNKTTNQLLPIDETSQGLWTTPDTYEAANVNQVMEWGVFLSKYTEWVKAPRDGYCGQFVNDYIKSMWITQQNLFLDLITDKTKYVNSQTPKVGSVMMMDSKNQPQYGHVAVVESINNDWTLNIKEANWNGDGKIHVRKNVDPSNMWVNVYGYFDPTIKTVATAETQTDSANAPLYTKYMDKWTMPSAAVLKWLWMTSAQFVKAASNYQFNSSATEDQRQQTQDIYDLLLELETAPGKEQAVWFSSQSFVPWFLPWVNKDERGIIRGSDAASYQAKFNTFKDTQVLPNLGKLKWPMSDKDIQFLRNTATSLNLDMSEKEYDAKLKEMKAKLEEKLWITWTTQQNNNTSTQQPNTTQSDPLWLRQ